MTKGQNLAGFDAVFRVLPADVQLLRACLAAARRRARVYSVRTHFAVGDDRAYLRFDGPSYALDILLERLRRDLPTIAEATPSRRSAPERRRVANGLIDILSRYRLQMYDRYHEDWLPTLRAKREPAYLLPHQLFVGDDALQNRLLITMDLLASWHYDEIAPEVLIEEMHTAAELLLKAVTPRRASRLSFAELVEGAAGAGLLSVGGHTLRTQPSGSSQRGPQDLARSTLLSLKDARKVAKHRGAAGAREWLDEYFWTAVSILESLSRHADQRGAASANPSR